MAAQHGGVEIPGAHIDKRVLRSRRLMAEAFERLLAVKCYEDITVTDIAREAGVDRKTFYKHFGSIDGLLAYLLGHHIESIAGSAHALLSQDGPSTKKSLDMRLRTFFEMVNVSIMKNIALDRRVFECVPFELLLSYTMASMREELRRYGAIPQGMSDELLEYHLSFVFGGILSVYRQWIFSDDRMPVEAVSNTVSALVARGIGSMDVSKDAPTRAAHA